MKLDTIMINAFKNAIRTIFANASEDDLSKVTELVVIKKLKAGEFWFREGMYIKDVAYLYKGYLRTFFLKNGKEMTDRFYFENSFPGDMPPIWEHSPSKSFCIAMESTTLLTLSYNMLNELAKENSNIEHALRLFTEDGFIRYYNKAVSFILQSPKERYEQLLAESPQVLQRAAQYHIASYLGITPQHLSRIRASKRFINKCE